MRGVGSAVVQINHRILERVGYPAVFQGWTHAANDNLHGSRTGDNKTTNENIVAGLNVTAGGDVGKIRCAGRDSRDEPDAGNSRHREKATIRTRHQGPSVWGSARRDVFADFCAKDLGEVRSAKADDLVRSARAAIDDISDPIESHAVVDPIELMNQAKIRRPLEPDAAIRDARSEQTAIAAHSSIGILQRCISAQLRAERVGHSVIGEDRTGSAIRLEIVKARPISRPINLGIRRDRTSGPRAGSIGASRNRVRG
jgi:hypothetical protein